MRLGLRIGLGRLFFQTHPHFNMQLNGMFGVPPRRRALDRSLSGPCCLHGPVAGHTLDSPPTSCFPLPGHSLFSSSSFAHPHEPSTTRPMCAWWYLCVLFVLSLSPLACRVIHSCSPSPTFTHPTHPHPPHTHRAKETRRSDGPAVPPQQQPPERQWQQRQCRRRRRRRRRRRNE